MTEVTTIQVTKEIQQKINRVKLELKAKSQKETIEYLCDEFLKNFYNNKEKYYGR